MPVNPSRVYALGAVATCLAVLQVFDEMLLDVADEGHETAGCSIASEHKDITNRGDRLDRLREVALVGKQASFSHGRYLLTVTVNETSPTSTRVRVNSRIEGYEAGYQVLRTSGLIEATVFAKLDTELGTTGTR